MTSIRNLVFSALLSASAVMSASTAHAVSPNHSAAAITSINYNGFRICKSLGDSGYTAIARGILFVGNGGRPGGSSFQIRTCFETANRCEQFISRIHHRVGNIEKINLLRCSPRG